MHEKDGMPPKQYEGPASYALMKEEKEIFFECLLYEGHDWLLVEYKGNNKYGREKVPEPKVS